MSDFVVCVVAFLVGWLLGSATPGRWDDPPPPSMSGFIAVVVAAALFAGQPAGQEYALEHLDPVIFWIPDELPPTYGVCVYAWGYHPMIYADGRTYSFGRVCWGYGAL